MLIERSVVPVFRQRIGEKSEHVGSGILSVVGGHYWLMTAAHVGRHQSEGILLIAGTPPVAPAGIYFASSELVAEAGRNDSVDLALFQILPDQANAVIAGGFEFLDIEGMDLGSTFRNYGNAIVVGYPDGFVVFDEKGTTSYSTPLVFHGATIPEEKMVRHGLSVHKQLGVFFTKPLVDVDGNPVIRVDPHNMSGGGVWVERQGHRILAGILTEFWSSNSLFHATRLWTLLPIIAAAMKRS